MLMDNRLLPTILIALLLILQGQIWLGKGSVPTVIELENKIQEQNELNAKAKRIKWPTQL